MEGSPRKRKAPKLLRGLQSKIGGKKSPAKPAAPPVSQQDHREAVLSLQQMALKIHSLQQQTTEKRKTLHTLLLKADSTSDPAELDKIKMRAGDIREELYNNELLMGNFEHTIERANSGTNDAFAVCAAFERYIEQTCQDNMDKITITAPTPTVISSLDELPDEMIDKISKAGILKDHCTTNFDQVLAVLRFIEKKQVYCTEAQLARWKSVKIGELMLPNYGRISKPIEHFLTDDKLALQPKKIYKFYGAEGQGGFGKVYHAKNKKTGNDVAIKKLKANTESQRRQIANEVSFLAFCSHQNLVPFENVFQIKNDEIWIVMEYIGGGTVNNALKKKSFSESIIATVSDQLLLALKYLHSNGIVHRDLKADNVMLTEFGEVFLVDMGLCVDLEEFNPACNSIGGTLTFMSPEAINGEEITPAVDIWSLGVTALEMANGCNPFSDNPILKMFQVAAKQVPSVDSLLLDPSKWSASFKDFISVCLNPDSSTRATAEQLLTHHWFAETISEDSQEELIHLVRYCWSSEVAPMF